MCLCNATQRTQSNYCTPLAYFPARSVREQTGVRKDSATNLARAFNYLDGQIPASVGGKTSRLWYDCLRGSRETYEKLHLRYLFIYLFHELYDEINQLVLQHLLRMEIRN